MLLIDASVWVAASEEEDRFHRVAGELVLDLQKPARAMDLTLYEIANAIGVKGQKPRKAAYMLEILRERCEGSVLAVDAGLMASAMEVAAEHDLTAYDAAYVAAARLNGWILVSIDIADLVSKGLAVPPDLADYP